MHKTIQTLIGVSLLIGAILLYNLGGYVFTGLPTIPTLENRWWAGYYDSHLLGRQWCVAVFNRDSEGKMRVALLSRSGAPDVLWVSRGSSNASFLDLVLEDEAMRIEARQLYEGKRYIFQRLFVGRLGDFWEMNRDAAIRGSLQSLSPPNEFGIEPIERERLRLFWRNYVKRADGLSPEELLGAVGFAIPVQ